MMSWGAHFWLSQANEDTKKKQSWQLHKNVSVGFLFHQQAEAAGENVDVMENSMIQKCKCTLCEAPCSWNCSRSADFFLGPHRFSHIKAEASDNLWTHKFERKKWRDLSFFMWLGRLLFDAHIRSSSRVAHKKMSGDLTITNSRLMRYKLNIIRFFCGWVSTTWASTLFRVAAFTSTTARRPIKKSNET